MRFPRIPVGSIAKLGFAFVVTLGLLANHLLRDTPTPLHSATLPTEIPHRLIIRFGSICCGTDMQAHKQLSGIIAKYEQKIGKSIVAKRINWGKEGEFTLCFTLTELGVPTETIQQSFVNDVRAAIRSNLVRIEEDVACKVGGT